MTNISKYIATGAVFFILGQNVLQNDTPIIIEKIEGKKKWIIFKF